MLQFSKFVAIRASLAILTLILVSFIVFTLMELVPGDCAERYVAFKNSQGAVISIADIEAERIRLGLNKPYVQRWGVWIINAFQGEFGDSCILRLNISQLLGQKFWLSLGLCLTSLMVAYIIAIPVGIISATSNNRVLNNSLRLVSYLGLALPNFLLALMVMLFSTVMFGDSLTGLFSKEFRDAEWSYERVMDFLGHAWLPIFILGWSATAFAIQTVRALMSDEIGKLYVTAAEARGVSGRRLLMRYPARHALSPIINSLGFDLNRIFNELPIVALILTLTEAGSLLIEALARSNDQQLAGAIIFMLTGSIVAINFLTDIILALTDPRVRRSIVG
ncbi:ABC transporter permease [Pseudohalocynthiibacter aestuariivivens]|jgi:peptide/nickel transport system permease protein|uniref:ABC transporter permease n=1 Tax=Pseudohalocynthiibacter aestuariivivens TaxID=1591409 RepID=A0ABV5JFD7_9RHOB|nr:MULTISPECIES: ABC transporter permease [Pseudohalocynthiibacter]MBS9717810.1 ABC transporter permease [Pseudohalocynthiibacter aestuariivivens]MCK0103040.1 ABC transporter permease [Pseudohalocynthiibacter sp. F2068]